MAGVMPRSVARLDMVNRSARTASSIAAIDAPAIRIAFSMTARSPVGAGQTGKKCQARAEHIWPRTGHG